MALILKLEILISSSPKSLIGVFIHTFYLFNKFSSFYYKKKGTTGDENLNKIVDHIFACFDKGNESKNKILKFMISIN